VVAPTTVANDWNVRKWTSQVARWYTNSPWKCAGNVDVRHAMKINEVLQEGAVMTAAYKDPKTGYWTFPNDYSKDKEVEAPYLGNASTRDLMHTLGLDPDFEEADPIEIDKFINITTQWLKANIGKRSDAEEPEVTKEPGSATMVSGGRPEGYFNQVIMRLNQVARKTREKYPDLTHVYFR